ncbi:LysR substrate-binding domain-containing protein [Aliiroseovarius crassostreae]|uniref:LysR substrate-binding domain-containing protein n=1 Tax=Aliiroseovarius crassostreae TaxID=154981 RepID=UPI0021FAB719|nr:LysR substrate-binding domain-containing protein [Aliiroseovarius crassostreae]UWQ06595.1 LysR family transcriptional regulator [Aliiroseovarius crassostreae]
MIDITLRKLRYFDALARTGHFGRAAEICAVSQPALSVQIKELEEMLATPLFERSPRHLRLTRFGQTFLTRAREILRAVDDLEQLARTSQGRLVGSLRIGIIPTIAPYLLPRIIQRLSTEYDEAEIHVRETQTSTLIKELKEGRIDMAILALPIADPAFAELALFDERFVLVRPEGEARTPVPSPEKLREMRLLLLEEGHCFRDQALSFCNLPTGAMGGGRVELREMLDGSSLATLVQMVGAGIGVTLIPEMAVSVETASAPVSVAHFPDPQPSRTIGMVWRKSSPMGPMFHDIAQTVRDCAQLASSPGNESVATLT